jgi:hypothetical protein
MDRRITNPRDYRIINDLIYMPLKVSCICFHEMEEIHTTPKGSNHLFSHGFYKHQIPSGLIAKYPHCNELRGLHTTLKGSYLYSNKILRFHTTPKGSNHASSHGFYKHQIPSGLIAKYPHCNEL